jgi:predicted negative regulator of RcsB-dependent stress response
MTRHPTARRVHREDSTPDDAFVAGVLESTAWAKQHQRALIIGGIIAAVLIAGLVLFLSNRSAQRSRAAAELSQVRSVALSGNTVLAIRDLEQFVGQYGNTPSGAEARLLLGSAYLDNGQIQQAIDVTQPMARNVDSHLGGNAALLVAAAFEMAGQPQRAEDYYLRVADNGRFLFQRQEALDNAARVRAARGDFAGAIQLYERILEITPQASSDRPFFELRLGEARVLAANPQAAAAAQGTAGTPAPDATPTPDAAPAPAPPATDTTAGAATPATGTGG